MIIPLFLWQKGLIRQPMFYISAFFESHRDTYYDGLLAVSKNDDWTGWCRFFLQAVQAQAEDNMKKAQDILALYNKLKTQVPELTHSQYAPKALDWIFGQPIFNHSAFIASSGIPEPTAKRILSVLESAGILKILMPGRGRRPTVVTFPALLNIAEGKELF